MFQHYFKIAIRSLLKFKGYSIINITGLALGLSMGILIMVYILDEISFDKFHTNGDRAFRVISGGETNAWPIGDILRRSFPEVEAVLYTRSATNLMVSFEGKKIREAIHYASPEFFKIFSFPLLKGNPETALNEPFSIVISEKMEEKYFSGQEALGKTLVFNDTLEFHVTGVMKDIPSNSHIRVDLLPSFESWIQMTGFNYSEGWGNFNMRNYVLLKQGTEPASFMKKTSDLYNIHAGDLMKQWGVNFSLGFEPLTRIYLNSKAGNGMGPLGSLTTVILLSGVGIFVILLACINFINLATARSVHRAKEVGIKKVAGSTRLRLIGQFLSESLIVTILSFFIALVAIGLLLPMFNELLSKEYSLVALLDLKIIVGISLLLIFITFCAGYYPAWVISALKPSEILKGNMQSGTRGVQLRRMLVVTQFVISISLVAGTLIVVNQLQYMQGKELGFTKEEVFVVNIARTKPVDGNAYDAFVNELKSQSVVKQFTFCNSLPSVSGWRGQWAYPEGKESKEGLVEMQYIAADENYINTIGLTLLAGRNFDPEIKSDNDALIINEEAVQQMGWGTPENAIGKRIVSPSERPAGIVIGVVKNYHDWGLQNKIAPSAIDFASDYSYLYAIRFLSGDTKKLIETLSGVWAKYFPENDFNYFFLSDTFARQYAQEQRLAKVFLIFSTTTILVAMIGLLGLVSFMITTKTKEIGIRKVLGASALNLTSLLSKEFILLVVIANIISTPLVIYVAQNWLQTFAYRMELNPMIFVFTTIIALTITFITISIQTIKAAMSDPVKSLRYE